MCPPSPFIFPAAAQRDRREIRRLRSRLCGFVTSAEPARRAVPEKRLHGGFRKNEGLAESVESQWSELLCAKLGRGGGDAAPR